MVISLQPKLVIWNAQLYLHNIVIGPDGYLPPYQLLLPDIKDIIYYITYYVS